MFMIASAESEALDRWREWLGDQAMVVEIRRLEALLECMIRLQPQLMLLDLRLQRAGMLRDIAQLLKVSSGTRIVAFVEECGEAHELALFRAGVRGVCALDLSRDTLLKVVAAVLQGDLWIRRALVPKLLDSISTQKSDAATGATGRFAILTPREIEITQLIAQGASNKHIAGYLAIAERTVKSHLTAIFRKTGVVDRVKLALLVARRH
jgi:two-component system nitrate/nitrite response regulator NarL